MRLPPELFGNVWFIHASDEDFFGAFPEIGQEELQEARFLASKGLPPATSLEAISVLFGYNPGLVRAFTVNTARYYRIFTIKAGKKSRTIASPKVALKIIQKWLGFHLSRIDLSDHVFGFVPHKSHIDAAEVHIGAKWAYSIDIKDFFGTTPSELVHSTLVELGYSQNGAKILTHLTTLKGALPQGSPASPPLSNLCFANVDAKLASLAERFETKLSRFADDITFSGTGTFPDELPDEIAKTLTDTPWTINASKVSKQPVKDRIKVYGLLVKDNHLALTKGYRNRIRAYRHLWLNGLVKDEDLATIRGHLNFARMFESRNLSKAHFDWANFPLNLDYNSADVSEEIFGRIWTLRGTLRGLFSR